MMTHATRNNAMSSATLQQPELGQYILHMKRQNCHCAALLQCGRPFTLTSTAELGMNAQGLQWRAGARIK